MIPSLKLSAPPKSILLLHRSHLDDFFRRVIVVVASFAVSVLVVVSYRDVLPPFAIMTNGPIGPDLKSVTMGLSIFPLTLVNSSIGPMALVKHVEKE